MCHQRKRKREDYKSCFEAIKLENEKKLKENRLDVDIYTDNHK